MAQRVTQHTVTAAQDSPGAARVTAQSVTAAQAMTGAARVTQQVLTVIRRNVPGGFVFTGGVLFTAPIGRIDRPHV